MVVALFRTLEFKKAFQLPIYYKYWRFFFYPDTYLKKLRMYLLLYYLYCLCKSVQRSLVLRLLFFSKANAKVRTLFNIFQIFSEVFFIFSFFKSSLLRKEEQRKNCRYRPGFKKIVKQRCSHFESGCKGKNFISYTPNKSEVFFIFLFKGGIHETNSTK